MLAKNGDIAEEMMYNTFNMGIGMVVAVDEKDVDTTIEAMKEAGDEAFVVGQVEAGEKGLLYVKSCCTCVRRRNQSSGNH